MARPAYRVPTDLNKIFVHHFSMTISLFSLTVFLLDLTFAAFAEKVRKCILSTSMPHFLVVAKDIHIL